MHFVKRILSLCFIGALFFSGAGAAEREITVTVDSKTIDFDVKPIIENDRTLVPMRFIFEALGAEVSWEDETKTATAVKGKITLSVTVGQMHLTKNGSTILLDTPAKLKDDRTLVPVRAVSEGMEAKVEWIDETSTVIITTTEPEGPFSCAELSEKDTGVLQKSADNLLHLFENTFLLKAANQKADLGQDICAKKEEARSFIAEEWNKTVIEKIKDVQEKSSSVYSPVFTDADAEKEGYLAIAAKAGMDEESLFVRAEFIPVPGGMMLLSEYKRFGTEGEDTSLLGLCAEEGKPLRLFGAWRIGKDSAYFVEITGGRTLNWGMIETEKFLETVCAKLNAA